MLQYKIFLGNGGKEMLLRELRTQKNLTQKELGEKIGESENTISNYERGVSRPSTDKLQLLAKVLGVSVDKLLGNVTVVEIPQAQDFAEPQPCWDCAVKDMQIKMLNERIEDLRERIADLRGFIDKKIKTEC